ncbi:MptD family putative ECF transporter S component [Solobacterium moorei]|uniref:MptD family putative ECF transporter S component n=1 Tax=Solobacterium moorei TaxID=102148 RepID=UPI000420AEC7|nr:MptD family putative ECF transporter S component [Solobacterium moorei]BET22917.1 MptD family putative ECF transporter S component [Solobacterium moorei]
MRLKMKDFVLLALLTALYIIVYFVAMMLISLMGPFGHAISPGVCGLLSGAILIFISRKIGKMWQFTLMELIIMGVFALMGAGYLPWFIASMVGAILADVIASTSNKPSVLKVAIASGLIHVGNALGGIIPACFFAEQYMNEWIARGQKPDQMLEMVKATQGTMGILATIIAFILSVIGVYIGYSILKGHLKED